MCHAVANATWPAAACSNVNPSGSGWTARAGALTFSGVPARQLDAEHLGVATQVGLADPAVRAGAALDFVLDPDPVTGPEPHDAGAHRIDLPGELDAELVGQRQRPARHACAQVDVEVVDPTGPHRDDHLARSGYRILELLVAQHVGGAVLVVADGVHASSNRM